MSLRDLRRRLKDSRLEKEQNPAPAEVPEKTPVNAGRAFDPLGMAAMARSNLEFAPSDLSALDELARLGAPHLSNLQKLDCFQLRGVLHEDSALVNAQVGSGKTTVLIQKIIHLLFLGVDPAKIQVFTFTRKAAAEISSRLELALITIKSIEQERPACGTFHSLARDLLNRSEDIQETGRTIGFRVLNQADKEEMLGALIDRDKLNIRYRTRLGRRLECLREGITKFGNMKYEDDIAILSNAFEEEKKRQNKVDFDDLISLATDVAGRLAEDKRPHWILVDELQDTDIHQLELLRNWCGNKTKIFAVGDPDQVIYSWRGSGVDVFGRFKEVFVSDELELAVNYRSSANILAAARFVLGVAKMGRTLNPTRPEGAPIVVREHFDQVAEAVYLTDTIKNLGPSVSVAILVRIRQQLEPIREQLAAAGLIVQVRENESTANSLRSFAKSYFGWLVDPDDGLALTSWISHKEFGLPSLRGRTFDHGVRKLADFGFEVEETLAWQRRLDQLREGLHSRSPLENAEDLLSATGIVQFLKPLSSRSTIWEESLLGWLRPIWKVDCTFGVEAILLEGIRLLSVNQSLHKVDFDSIQLMTIHTAKGLEFDHVFVSGMNRGLMPISSSWGDKDKEAEERRLLFVAMTRAKNCLEISWFRSPTMAQVFPEPSPYLDLIPDCLLEDEQESLQGNHDTTWGSGMLVRHPRYGEGVVIDCQKGQVTCLFEKLGRKVFPTNLCPLT